MRRDQEVRADLDVLQDGDPEVDLEAAAGPVLNKSGAAYSRARTIDGEGLVREVGALPEVTATFVTALGLSLIL